MRRIVAGAVLALSGLAFATGCTSRRVAPAPIAVTRTQTRTVTLPPPVTLTLEPVHSVAPLPYGAPAPTGEIERACPYLQSDQDQGPVNVADIVGSHVYRTTVLTTLRPVGCRFYFYAPPYEAIADIVPQQFPTAHAAHNALVRTAAQGTDEQSHPNFVKGVDGIGYRTEFFGVDGDRDWAFAFAKGPVLVVVHTYRDDIALNALLIAKAIVGKF